MGNLVPAFTCRHIGISLITSPHWFWSRPMTRNQKFFGPKVPCAKQPSHFYSVQVRVVKQWLMTLIESDSSTNPSRTQVITSYKSYNSEIDIVSRGSHHVSFKYLDLQSSCFSMTIFNAELTHRSHDLTLGLAPPPPNKRKVSSFWSQDGFKVGVVTRFSPFLVIFCLK